MTSNDAKKLRRTDLLELLIEQTEENQRLLNKITQLETKLSERVIVMEQAGSIAEAAMNLSDVFAQAQDSADRYLESIRQKQTEAEDLVRQAQEKAQALLQKTEAECTQQRQEAEAECTQQRQKTEAECTQQRQKTETECAQQREKARADCEELEHQTHAECEKRLAEAEQKAAEIVAASANSLGAPTAATPSKRRGFIGRLLNRR